MPVYHPDVRVCEVKDKTTGKHVGLWYFDPYARAGKRSGAWMNAYRDQERFEGEVTTIVSNNSNFVKGKPGEPVLISWDDAVTLFHEFGHALHGLSLERDAIRRCRAPHVARDYVEFPSQLLEHWLLDARGAASVRAALPDRRADPAGAGRQDREGRRPSTRASTRSSTWRARSST